MLDARQTQPHTDLEIRGVFGGCKAKTEVCVCGVLGVWGGVSRPNCVGGVGGEAKLVEFSRQQFDKAIDMVFELAFNKGFEVDVFCTGSFIDVDLFVILCEARFLDPPQIRPPSV